MDIRYVNDTNTVRWRPQTNERTNDIKTVRWRHLMDGWMDGWMDIRYVNDTATSTQSGYVVQNYFEKKKKNKRYISQ